MPIEEKYLTIGTTKASNAGWGDMAMNSVQLNWRASVRELEAV